MSDLYRMPLRSSLSPRSNACAPDRGCPLKGVNNLDDKRPVMQNRTSVSHADTHARGRTQIIRLMRGRSQLGRPLTQACRTAMVRRA